MAGVCEGPTPRCGTASSTSGPFVMGGSFASRYTPTGTEPSKPLGCRSSAETRAGLIAVAMREAQRRVLRIGSCGVDVLLLWRQDRDCAHRDNLGAIANCFEPEFDADQERPGFTYRRAEAVGGNRAPEPRVSLHQIPPPQAALS